MSRDATPMGVIEGHARWCLVEGDCLQVMPTLPPKSVTHVITDPPYGEWVHSQAAKAGRRWDGSASLSPIGFAALADSVRTAAALEFGRIAARWCLVFSDFEGNHFWRTDLSAASLRSIRPCVWVKTNSSPQFSGDRPSAAIEAIQVSHAPGQCRWNGGGSHGVWTHPIERTERHHDTPKPLPLMLELVELFTDPDDVVLDAFAGSGTTGVACLRLGRRFIGIEKDAKYAEVCRERLEAESRGLTLRDARAGQTSLFDLVDKPEPAR